MSILLLTDREGDPVALDSDRIIGVETAMIKYEDDTRWRATVVTLERGVRFYVAEPFEAVYHKWIAARGETVSPRVNPHPNARGWEQNPAVYEAPVSKTGGAT